MFRRDCIFIKFILKLYIFPVYIFYFYGKRGKLYVCRFLDEKHIQYMHTEDHTILCDWWWEGKNTFYIILIVNCDQLFLIITIIQCQFAWKPLKVFVSSRWELLNGSFLLLRLENFVKELDDFLRLINYDIIACNKNQESKKLKKHIKAHKCLIFGTYRKHIMTKL